MRAKWLAGTSPSDPTSVSVTISPRWIAQGGHHFLDGVLESGQSPRGFLYTDPDDARTARIGKAAQFPDGEGGGRGVASHGGQRALDLGQPVCGCVAQKLERQVDARRPHPAHAAGWYASLQSVPECGQFVQYGLRQGDSDERTNRLHIDCLCFASCWILDHPRVYGVMVASDPYQTTISQSDLNVNKSAVRFKEFRIS